MAFPKFTITTGRVESLPIYNLYGGDAYDRDFAEYHYGKRWRLASSMLNEKKYTIKDTDQSYRLINHWSGLGLIADDRRNAGEWRKLSMIDIVWIHVVVALRGFGLPLDKLRMTQQTLFAGSSKDSQCPFFEFAIALALMKNEQFLIVFPDGKATVMDGNRIEWNRLTFHIDDYICIDLNRIVSRIFKDKDFTPIYQASTKLNDDELDVLLHMRSGNYESVSVKMKDGKVELIEATQSVESQKKFIELVKEAKYQKIEVQTADGKIVSIKRTVKQKGGTDGDNIKVYVNGQIVHNPQAPTSDKYKSFFFSGDLSQSKKETLMIPGRDFLLNEQDVSIELWYDETPLLETVKFELEARTAYEQPNTLKRRIIRLMEGANLPFNLWDNWSTILDSVQTASDAAQQYAREQGFTETGDNGEFQLLIEDNEPDALRHFTWNVLLTRDFDDKAAEIITTNHEVFWMEIQNKKDLSRSNVQDMWNNKAGRKFAVRYPDTEHFELFEIAKSEKKLILNLEDVTEEHRAEVQKNIGHAQ